ncbi:unnamed protein product [Rotaria magnacalcarata]|uniref:Uncharacterized protein n=1 Tax=Rotaria magnacalcarata TaxID=392030 RepID=A0A816EPL4_9BILA|nr:unnamed protein product [Rotaria magnacalcarata]CAF4093844.1 unnamed protein product [Rotaria magnacalcarata]
MYSSLELPDDVLTYRDKDFFDLVHKKCGEIVKDLMEKLFIDSIKTLLGVEDDIFSIVQENCSALKDIKERACLCLDDGTVIVKSGLRIDLDRLIEALRTNSIHSQISKSTTALSDNDSSLSNTLTKFNMFEENSNSFLKDFINNIASNKKKSKNNYRYSTSVQSFSQALYIMEGRNAYEFVRLNLSGAVPSITSIDSFISKAGGKIMEGEFRYDTLHHLQTSNNYQLAVCSEDCTGVIQKIVYDAPTNTFIGFSTPLDRGIPVPQYFQTDSYEQLKVWFENEDKSSLLNVHMLELLTTSKSSSSSFLLGAYGITSKFNSIDVLRRWLWIFEHCQTSNIRILAFSTDCDPKYLRAMRLITGFFAKLPNIPISERDDAREVKLPKGWSSWFYMRTRQLVFCFQDPVHLCTKMRNRLLSQSASMMIGNGEISVSILFDLINNQSKLIHGLVKTDVHPKDKQNFGSCVKISSDDVLSALDDVSGSYAIQVYLRLLRSIILAYIERSTSTIDRIYHSWITVFICRLWWAAYHSIEINAHTLLSVLLVCQHDLPESALAISSYNSQTCENIFRSTRSMSGTFSSNVNFTVAQFLRRAGKLAVLQEIERQNEQDDSECSLQFSKHHKRRLRKAEHVNDHLQNNNILTQNNIEKTVCRAYNDAYKMLAVLGIDKIFKKAHKSTLTELSTFVKIQTEQQSHTTDYSENWNGYSDDESDSEAENAIDQSDMSAESSSEDENG